MKFNFKKIYIQRAVYDDFIWRERAEDIIKQFPAAQIVEVESHCPDLQVPKKTAPDTLVYDYNFRRRELAEFERSLGEFLPYCPVRYSF